MILSPLRRHLKAGRWLRRHGHVPSRVSAVVVVMCVAVVACGGGSGAGKTASTTTSAAPISTAATRPVALSQRLEASLPSAVQETAAAATATRLYVVGGYDANGESVSSVFAFDGAHWANGPTFPIAVNHPAGAALNADLYIAGGFTSGSATNRVFVLAHGTTAWKEVASLHAARAAAALLAVGRYLYAIGGLDGSTQVASVERYDPATNTWTVIAQMPHPRNHVAGYVDGRQACVAGGREPATSSAIDCLDTTTTTWTPRIPVPTATSGAAAGLLRGRLIVAGGEPSGETTLVPVVQELSGISWSTEAMLDPRHGTGFAHFQGRFWMCGGATAPGYHASATCTSMGA